MKAVTIRPIVSVLTATLALNGLSACQNTPSHYYAPSSVSTASAPTAHSGHSGHTATWGYDGDHGPDTWSDVHGNETCKIGNAQSPINIARVRTSGTAAPQIQYGTADLLAKNNGHTVVFAPTSQHTTTIDGDTYTLQQLHYHTPSEHQIAGQTYPAELHFVHANATGDLAVIAVMLNPTAMAPTLQGLAETSARVNESGYATALLDVDLADLIPANSEFYAYGGSLTTPPCSENVKWFVADRALPTLGLEISLMAEVYSGNNRPLQPQGTREVLVVK